MTRLAIPKREPLRVEHRGVPRRRPGRGQRGRVDGRRAAHRRGGQLAAAVGPRRARGRRAGRRAGRPGRRPGVVTRSPRVVLATRLFAPEVAAASLRLRWLASALADLGAQVEVITTTPAGRLGADRRRPAAAGQPLAGAAGQGRRGARLRALPQLRPAALRPAARPPPSGRWSWSSRRRRPAWSSAWSAPLRRTPYAYYAADVLSDALASGGRPGPARRRCCGRWSPGCCAGPAGCSPCPTGWPSGSQALGVPPDANRRGGQRRRHRRLHPGRTGPGVAGAVRRLRRHDVAVAGRRRLRAGLRQGPGRPSGRAAGLPRPGQRRGRTCARWPPSSCPGGVDFRGVVPPEECAAGSAAPGPALVSIKPGIGYDFAKPTKVYAATACGVPAIFAGRGAGNELVEAERLGWRSATTTTSVARR